MKKHGWKKTAALLMSICITFGMAPLNTLASQGNGQAKETGKKVWTWNQGTTALEAPSQSSLKWSGSRLYFGRLTYGTKSAPILWRVLDPSAENPQKGILLQTDEVLLTGAFAEITADGPALGETGDQTGGLATDTQGKYNIWKDSAVARYLNSAKKGGFLYGFDALQREAVLKSTVKAGESISQGGVSYTNPASQGSQVFLLSAWESSREEYGYGTEGARRMVSGGDSDVTREWWLRSALEGSDTQAAVIDKDGRLTGKEVLESKESETTAAEAGIAPALYLDGSRIAFMTPADQKKPQQVSRISEYLGERIWKLTLFGTKKDMKAAIINGGDQKCFERNQVIQLTYNSADSLKGSSQSGFVPNQVSLLVLNQDKEAVYYGGLTSSTDSVRGEWKIPADMPGGSYELYIFAEDINASKEADYASALGKGISFSVAQKETPVLIAYPEASAIVYGQTLGEAILSGGEVQAQGQRLEGSFSWKDPSVKPAAADSNVTEYEAVFTPFDSTGYNSLSLKLRLEVKRAQLPQPLPEESMSVDFGIDMVKKAALPAGWSWKQEYQETVLNVGSPVQAAAVYQDTSNYEGAERTITITRQSCTHQGETYVVNAKSASCTEEGYTGDTYCSICSALLKQGEVITKDAHYYNGTRTIHWVGCEQQGEIEHYCSCGDSYIEIIPALGHDFKEEITRKATADAEGIKTYTCSRCGYAYTEAIPRLEAAQNTGSSPNQSQTSGERLPYVKGNTGISGWNDINKHILKAAEGAEIQIVMNGSLILPEKILTTIQGKNITLQLDMGENIIWKLSGQSVAADRIKDMNLKLTRNSNTIPEETVKLLAGEKSSIQLSFAQEGEFCAVMELQLLLDSNKNGQYANLFFYNKEEGTLVYQESRRTDQNGSALLTIQQPGEYLVVLDPAEFDGAVRPEEIQTEETPPAEPETEETVQPPVQKEGVSALVIIIIGLILLGIGLLLIVFLRARSHRQQWEEEEQPFESEEEQE